MSTTMIGYLLLCAGIGLVFSSALKGKPIVERLGAGLGFALILASIGLILSGVLS